MYCTRTLKFPTVQPFQSVHGGVGFVGGRSIHAICKWRKYKKAVYNAWQNRDQHSMVHRGCYSRRKELRYFFQQVVQQYAWEHGIEQERRKIVMEIEYSTHGPKRDVVEHPRQEKPGTSNQLLFVSFWKWLYVTSLLLNSINGKYYYENAEKAQITPPNYRVAEQIDSVCRSGEKLSSIINRPLPRPWSHFSFLRF